MPYDSRSPGVQAPWQSLATPLVRFAAVARHEHVTRAAEELGVPQPTLSRSLARLERDLGVPLLLRTGRRVRLTRQGRLLLDCAEQVLGQLERTVEDIGNEVGAGRGRVAFGFLHSLGSEAVPSLLRDFRAEQPGVRFQLLQGYADSMLERLRAGELDLCLTAPLPEATDIAVRPLDEQRLYLVVPREHPLARRRRVRLAEVAHEPFVAMEPGYGLRRIFDTLCDQAGFTPRIGFEGEEAETLRGLVAAGLGVALLPAPERPRQDTVQIAVTAPSAHRTIGLAWMRDGPHSAPVTAFREFVLGRRGHLLTAHR